MLKNAKIETARNNGNSTLVVASPSQRSYDNYKTLLIQLDVLRSTTATVQQKSEARYIAERSIGNMISHVMAVAISHYLIGIPDNRVKSIDNATDGAKQIS